MNRTRDAEGVGAASGLARLGLHGRERRGTAALQNAVRGMNEGLRAGSGSPSKRTRGRTLSMELAKRISCRAQGLSAVFTWPC